MKKIFTIVSLLSFCSILWSQALNQTYLDYIAEYRDMAIEQQRKHGVPASITMAQGILESSAGTSYLAVNGHITIFSNIVQIGLVECLCRQCSAQAK